MKQKPKVASEPSFQDLQAQLEDLLSWFDKPDVDLDQALVKYEQALAIITRLETRLKETKNRIQVINQKFDVE